MRKIQETTEELLTAAKSEDLDVMASALKRREVALRDFADHSFTNDGLTNDSHINDSLVAQSVQIFEQGETALAILRGLKRQLHQEYSRLTQLRNGFSQSGIENAINDDVTVPILWENYTAEPQPPLDVLI